MKSETFMAPTLDEAKKAKEQWLSSHQGVIIKKEYDAVVMRKPAGQFTPIADGKVLNVSIRIDYESSN